MTYPIQFRKKVIKLHTDGIKYEDLSFRFGISIRTLSRWKKRIEPEKTRNKPWKKLNKEAVIEDIKQFPDSYGYERAIRLGVSKSGIQYAIKRLGISYKKNSKSPKSGARKKVYVLPKNRAIRG